MGLLGVVLAVICAVITMKILDKPAKEEPKYWLHGECISRCWFWSERSMRKHLHEITVNGQPAIDIKQEVFPGDVIVYKNKRLEVK